jgi:hypothetical protein
MILVASLMVTEAEADELYRPYDTLKAIGFSTDDAKSFLGSIEGAAQSQIPPEPKSEPEVAVKYSVQRSMRRSQLRRGVLLVALGYSIAVWLYVVAMQLFYPNSIYFAFATWLPIRMDYVGEAAFVFSIISATALIMSKPRLNMKTGRDQTKTTPTHSR